MGSCSRLRTFLLYPPTRSMIDAIFVYGTLKRGQVRERCWPRAPVRVVAAVMRGELHDLGPYPALIPGDDRVLGELWFLRAEDVAESLRVLDEVECYGIDDVDLYVRRVVECEELESSERHSAFVYHLANENDARAHPRVPPRADGLVEWLPTDPRGREFDDDL
ncbi:MAG: gamma-glutamylcyclotransferase family protein [Pirellulales bacterium]